MSATNEERMSEERINLLTDFQDYVESLDNERAVEAIVAHLQNAYPDCAAKAALAGEASASEKLVHFGNRVSDALPTTTLGDTLVALVTGMLVGHTKGDGFKMLISDDEPVTSWPASVHANLLIVAASMHQHIHDYFRALLDMHEFGPVQNMIASNALTCHLAQINGLNELQLLADCSERSGLPVNFTGDANTLPWPKPTRELKVAQRPLDIAIEKEFPETAMWLAQRDEIVPTRHSILLAHEKTLPDVCQALVAKLPENDPMMARLISESVIMDAEVRRNYLIARLPVMVDELIDCFRQAKASYLEAYSGRWSRLKQTFWNTVSSAKDPYSDLFAQIDAQGLLVEQTFSEKLEQLNAFVANESLTATGDYSVLSYLVRHILSNTQLAEHLNARLFGSSKEHNAVFLDESHTYEVESHMPPSFAPKQGETPDAKCCSFYLDYLKLIATVLQQFGQPHADQIARRIEEATEPNALVK